MKNLKSVSKFCAKYFRNKQSLDGTESSFSGTFLQFLGLKFKFKCL
jgi:hypothetical protein